MGEGKEGRVAVKTLIIGAPRDASDILALRSRVRLLAEAGDRDPIVCDAGELTDADCGTVDQLARLQLIARRRGRRICLRRVSSELHELLAVAGLCDVLGCPDWLGLETGGQAEEREEPGGVQEERDAADPIA